MRRINVFDIRGVAPVVSRKSRLLVVHAAKKTGAQELAGAGGFLGMTACR